MTELPTPASDSAATMASAAARAIARQQLATALTGNDQRWRRICQQAVADGAHATLALLAAGSTEAAALASTRNMPQHSGAAVLVRRTVEEERLWLQPELLDGETAPHPESASDSTDEAAAPIAADLAAGLATAALAKGITGAWPVEHACAEFLRHADGSGLHSVGSQLISARDLEGVEDPRLLDVVLHLIRRTDSPARGYAIVAALDLAGLIPRKLRTTYVSVLFALRDADGHRGEAGTLKLIQLQHGPSGLHPDPARMSFLQADSKVTESLTAAWLTSSLAATDACVLWSVERDRRGPANAIHGGSMAAAIAVALDDLAPRWQRFRQLRPRRLDHKCAITAGLSGETLTGVTGYKEKFEAAQERGLRVVVAESELESARPQAPPGLIPLGASTLREAVRRTRTKLNLRLYTVVTVTMLLVAIGGGAFTMVQRAQHQSEIVSLAASLATRSSELSNSDSRMSALMALAADRLHPTEASRTAMLNAVQNNQSVRATGVAESNGPVSSLAASGEVLLTAGRSNVVKAWRIPRMEPVGELHVDESVRGVVAGARDSFAIVDRSKMRIYQGALGRLPVEVKALELPDASALFKKRIFGPFFDDRTGAYAVIDEDFDGVYWAPGMARAASFALRGEAGDGAAKIVASSDFGALHQWLFNTGDDRNIQSLLLGTDQRQIFRLAVHKTPDGTPRFGLDAVVAAADVMAPITSLFYSDDDIQIGTEQGIQRWDVPAALTRAFPYGGISERVDAQLLTGAGVVALTPSGLKLMKLNGITVPLNNISAAAAAHGLVTSIARAGDLNGFLVGRNDGRVLILDPTYRWLGLEDRPRSNLVAFTPQNLLLTTSPADPQRTDSLRVSSVPAPEKNRTDTNLKVYNISGAGDGLPYINDAAGNDRIVVAAGQSRQTGGRLWVWDAQSWKVLVELDFRAETPTANIDMVTNIVLAPTLNVVAGLNPGRGDIGIWSTADWQRVATIPIVHHSGYEDLTAIRMTASTDGTTLLAQVTRANPRRSYQAVIDLRNRRVVRELAIEGDSWLSPDGTKFAVSPNGRDLVLYDIEGRRLSAAIDLKTQINDVSWRPDAGRLALSLSEARQVVFIDTARMLPDGPPWNTTTGTAPYQAAWSPDGTFLAINSGVVSNDKPVPASVQLLRPGSINWPEALCAIAGTDLTDQEWRSIAGAVASRPQLCP
ncbi:hypothetical protein GFY24_39795 [Nocardia sp. SYP-A9097]|uniref:WD40 repeat domain-containing protein n=1 Tax=Nocardia sp. SYP-A9097 TaxID=2663237 RepID=UPI00129BC545|nr:WD40 repeat domain-containing protein [Nocardia sp. SYP-A9097]MRH93483.1 hypothetical protein [Nocardia sp. SYP-A9097]